MQAPERQRSVPLLVKIIIFGALAVFLITQGIALLGAGGIAEKYTFLEGFTKFDDLMLADPLTTAGFIDLMVLMLAFALVLIDGLPRGRFFPLLLIGFLAVLVIYPGLAALGFLLLYWRRWGQFRPN